MEEKNELNNIILNKGGSSAGSKKIILAVATLGVTLIVVIMLMNTLTSKGTENLPQAMLPPEPQAQYINPIDDEPLFEDVEVVEENQQANDSLDKIAQKLKEESIKEKSAPITKTVKKEIPKPKIVKKETPKTVVKKEITRKVVKPTTKTSSTGNLYIQVGSFAKYEPNKKFLSSITNLGYKYKFHKVTQNAKVLNKVLVGPFSSESEARKALKSIRSSVEAGAFLTKI